ncbi:hypothetical protein [Edaphobacter aggregans]|uniref:hypothetical protein n=1 Tax=Edaphobacter aggregans TaxID=570835 RepID=UPI000551DE43|nr:hypothetical protein [Edaphobacter aggregans]
MLFGVQTHSCNCGSDVDAVEQFPYSRNTVVACPLCGELRRYRPSEVFLGWVDGLVEEQKASRRFRPFVRKPPRREPDRED